MVIEQSEHIITEVKKAFMGKDEIIRKVLMTIYAGGSYSAGGLSGRGKDYAGAGVCQCAGAGL